MVARNCTVCNAFFLGGGVCAKCKAETADCPICHEGSAQQVCRACINAGAPWCRGCVGVMGDTGGEFCFKCVAAKGGLPTPDKFAVNDAPIGTGVEGHYRYEPAGAGATLPAPSFEIPR